MGAVLDSHYIGMGANLGIHPPGRSPFYKAGFGIACKSVVVSCFGVVDFWTYWMCKI